MNDFSVTPNVGRAFGHLRLKRSLSQVAVEKRSGVNHSDLAAYESGTKPLPKRTVKRLLVALEYDAATLADLLDAAEPLQLELEGAKLLEDKVEPRSGRPTRVLVLEPRDGLRSAERKMLKGREAVLKLWLDENGVPVALDRTEKLKFTKLFISFNVSVHESRTYSRVGNRLVVAALNTESSGSGFGQSGKSRKAVRVAVGA